MAKESWKEGGIVPIVELNLFDPALFRIDEKKHSRYGEWIRIGPIARCICESKLWDKKDEAGKTIFQLRHINEPHFFLPGVGICVRYQLDTGDDPSPRTVWVDTISKEHRLCFCSDYHDLKTMIAGWTVTASLAEVARLQHHLVGEAETYASETATCNDDLANIIGASQIPLVQCQASFSLNFGITGFKPMTGNLIAHERILIAAGIYFLRMEQTLQAGAHEMGQKVASISSTYHPRSRR